MDVTKAIEVQVINAFTDGGIGGNQAGVVVAADALSTRQKLAIAAKVGLSETAFVSKSKIADFKLDFFTPNRQIAHCGHATIAAFSYLNELNQLTGSHSSKETLDGCREILLLDGFIFMEQTAPRYQEVSSHKEKILQSLSLSSADLLKGAPIQIINTGNSFAVIAVKDSKTLAGLLPAFALITQISEELDLIGYYVFTTETNDPARDADARMFAPRYGIKEEAGTGMAAGPLACYLYDVLNSKKERFLIRQGLYMEIPSPSLIIVDLAIENSKISRLMAGGQGIVSRKVVIAI